MRRRRVRRSDPLHRPAMAVIGGYAQRLLRATDVAVARLADANDLEALHDSRVCLRRLRGWLLAFDSQLKLKHRQRRALRSLAHDTNMARDAEVCIQWIAKLRTSLDSRPQAGVTGFINNLGALRDKNYRRIRMQLPPAWKLLSRKLQHTASVVHDSGRVQEIFLRVYAASLRDYAADFSNALERTRLSPDAARIHRVRITAKKLRYLLESTLRWHSQAKALVAELKALHKTAGDIQDLERIQALAEQVFLQQAGARYRRLLVLYTDVGADHRTLKRPDLTPGLLPLLLVSRAAYIKQAEYIARFKKDYLARKRPACVIQLQLLIIQLTRCMQHTQAEY
jgi:CHAD domain-containing protein